MKYNQLSIRLMIWLAIGLSIWLVIMTSCTDVAISRHPDYNFPPTNPSTVAIYDRMTPTWPFVMIGRITIDATWTVSVKEADAKVRKMAAQAGADAVIVTDFDMNIYAFNRYVTVDGYTSGDAFHAAIVPHAMYIVEKKVYGYLIKRTE